jgi:hypothetical protein
MSGSCACVGINDLGAAAYDKTATDADLLAAARGPIADRSAPCPVRACASWLVPDATVRERCGRPLPCCQVAAWQDLHAAAGACGSVLLRARHLRPYSIQALHCPCGLRRLAGTLSGPAHDHAWRPAGRGGCCRSSVPRCLAPTWFCKACCRAARSSPAATCLPGPIASRPPSLRSMRSMRRGPAAVTARSHLTMLCGVQQRAMCGQDASVRLSRSARDTPKGCHSCIVMSVCYDDIPGMSCVIQDEHCKQCMQH